MLLPRSTTDAETIHILEKVKVQNRTEAKSSQFLKLFQKAQLLSHSRARHSSSGAKMNNKSGKQSKEDELCAESTTTSLTRLPEPGTAATIRLGWILSGPRPDPTKVNTSEILQHLRCHTSESNLNFHLVSKPLWLRTHRISNWNPVRMRKDIKEREVTLQRTNWTLDVQLKNAFVLQWTSNSRLHWAPELKSKTSLRNTSVCSSAQVVPSPVIFF